MPDDLDTLQGTWTVTAKWCQRITRGDVTTVLAGPQVMLKARFTLDASRTPKAIDYVNLEGPQARKPQAGIFELKGDSLRICMSGSQFAFDVCRSSCTVHGLQLTVKVRRVDDRYPKGIEEHQLQSRKDYTSCHLNQKRSTSILHR
jgi:uncharacterized protein (TIGR03067 family)